MNSKTISLFRRLMDGQPHKLAELAEYLQTSPRLVRYEMSEAGAFLEKEGLGTILQHNREEGWRLTPTAEERQLLEEKLSNLDTRDYVMSSAERRIVMQLMLLDKIKSMNHKKNHLYFYRKTHWERSNYL